MCMFFLSGVFLRGGGGFVLLFSTLVCEDSDWYRRHLFAAGGTICIWMLMVLVDHDLNVKTDSSKRK